MIYGTNSPIWYMISNDVSFKQLYMVNIKRVNPIWCPKGVFFEERMQMRFWNSDIRVATKIMNYWKFMENKWENWLLEPSHLWLIKKHQSLAVCAKFEYEVILSYLFHDCSFGAYFKVKVLIWCNFMKPASQAFQTSETHLRIFSAELAST